MTIAEQLKQTPAFRGCCSFLSNFSPYRLEERHEHEGIIYPSNEHFYQAMKFYDPKIQQLVAHHPFAGLKAFVRSKHIDVGRWEGIKDAVMLKGLTHKFSFQRFSDQLIGTEPHELVEYNTWGDTYWGVCNGKGENKLGKMLMEIRSKI